MTRLEPPVRHGIRAGSRAINGHRAINGYRAMICTPAAGRAAAACVATLLVASAACLAESPLAESPGPGDRFFHHESFADFAAGKVSSPGAGLYVARRGDRGEIRWLNRFDLDGDGFPEVVIVNDHNHFDTPPAVLHCWKNGTRPRSLLPPIPEERARFEVLQHYAQTREHTTFLPVPGGLACATGDFNGDGWQDIAISGFVHGWNSLPYPLVLYLGSPDGFDPQRRVVWTAGFFTGIAAADLDGDGCDDVVVAQRDGEYNTRFNTRLPRDERRKVADTGRHSRVLFGSPSLGPSPRSKDLEAVYAVDAATADLDGDTHPDLVLYEAGRPASVTIHLAGHDRSFSGPPQSIEVGDNVWGFIQRKVRVASLRADRPPDIVVPTQTGVVILHNDGSGVFSKERMTTLPLPDPFDTACGDFDGDGQADLAVAVSGGESCVLVNDGGDPTTIGQWKRMTLPLRHAVACAAADIDGDGCDDLAVAVNRDAEAGTYDASSVVLWGSGVGIDPGNATPYATFGAAAVTTLPSPTDPGKRDILFVNRQSGLHGAGTGPTTGGMPTYVYWGGPTRSYSEMSMLKLPPVANERSIVVTDLEARDQTDVVGIDLGNRRLSVQRIDGREFRTVKQFPLSRAGAVPLVLDFDHDGVLDLAVTGESEPMMDVVRDPFGDDPQVESVPIPFPPESAALGDIDGDGFADLVGCGRPGVFVLPGAAGGFDHAGAYSVALRMLIKKVALVDVDGDERLDAVTFNWSDLDDRGVVRDNRIASSIFRNVGGRLALEQPAPLPTLGGALQGTVADVDRDGRPDILSANYHGGDIRHLDMQLFWNGGTEPFSRARSLTLPAFSAAAVQAMDYDADGWMDILVLNHSESTEMIPGLPLGGRHSVGARLYWGSEDGHVQDRFTWIPSFGPHSKIDADPGNIFDRSSRERYVSAEVAGPARDVEVFLLVRAKLGRRATVTADCRSGAVPLDSSWQPLPLAEQAGDLLRFGPVKVAAGTAFQYRLSLDSQFLGTLPVVEAVSGLIAE